MAIITDGFRENLFKRIDILVQGGEIQPVQIRDGRNNYFRLLGNKQVRNCVAYLGVKKETCFETSQVPSAKSFWILFIRIITPQINNEIRSVLCSNILRKISGQRCVRTNISTGM